MAAFCRLGARRIGLLTVLMTTALSCHANGWSDELLGLTGTSIVFDAPVVQQALQKDTRPDFGQILQQTGLKPWAGARIWLVQLVDNKPRPFVTSKVFESEANHRGLIINTALSDTDKTTLAQMLAQPKISWSNLQKLLNSQHSDALVLINSQNNTHFWQLFAPPQRFVGNLAGEGFNYLPHIWSENLAMSWQWPELKQNILIHIDGLHNFAQFKAAEKALETACVNTQVLRSFPDGVDFSCRSANNLIPEKLSLIPQLVVKPMNSNNLDEATLMGRQLAQRYVAYQWRSDIY